MTGSAAGTDLHSPSLRERYLAYREAQGRELLNVIPREGVRSLLRHFRASEDLPADEGGEEILAGIASRCSRLLPLPPFEEWVKDFHESRSEYASFPGPPFAPQAPDGEPVTVEVRTLVHGEQEWVASLALRPADDAWVGHVRFHPQGSDRVFRTGDIFREPSPIDVRERFQSFDDRTLNAFLRSALP